MPLSNFRLSCDQSNNRNVVVLADDGKIRVITHVSRDAIEEYFDCDLTVATQQQRISIVEVNLAEISRIIKSKYTREEFTTYTDSLGITDTNNKLINITSQDLSGIRLS
jgi:hypothetical protein